MNQQVGDILRAESARQKELANLKKLVIELKLKLEESDRSLLELKEEKKKLTEDHLAEISNLGNKLDAAEKEAKELLGLSKRATTDAAIQAKAYLNLQYLGGLMDLWKPELWVKLYEERNEVKLFLNDEASLSNRLSKTIHQSWPTKMSMPKTKTTSMPKTLKTLMLSLCYFSFLVLVVNVPKL